MIDVLLHNEPYRYIKMEELLENGEPDYRIQKFSNYSGRYKDMYLCDNFMQMKTAIEDLYSSTEFKGGKLNFLAIKS